ncbi:MAG: outer membrane beta-barrel protein [Nitrospira sp.]
MRVLLSLLLLLASLPSLASAEWYVAGQFGANFPGKLTAIRGTGILKGLDAPDFDLKTSYAYGGKIGVYPGHHILGAELDVLYSNPHIKNLEEIPGIHLSVTTIGLHMLIRYPGPTVQPYAGIGPAILVSHLGSSATTRADSNVTVGLDFLAGVRAFVTPTIAVFTEYKYTLATLRFTDAFGDNSGFHGDYRVNQLVVGLSYHF